MDELVWHEHKGGLCPVPMRTLVMARFKDGSICTYGIEARALVAAATLAVCTHFAIDPNQRPQLDGPLEVGAMYICRNGDIRKIVAVDEDDGSAVVQHPHGKLHVRRNGVAYGEHPHCDLIARYYGPDTAGEVDLTPTKEAIQVFKNEMAKTRAPVDERAAWEARWNAKWLHVHAQSINKPTPAQSKPRTGIRLFAPDLEGRRCHLMGGEWK